MSLPLNFESAEESQAFYGGFRSELEKLGIGIKGIAGIAAGSAAAGMAAPRLAKDVIAAEKAKRQQRLAMRQGGY